MKFTRAHMVAGLTVPAALFILTACGPASSTAANAPSPSGSAGVTVAASPSPSGSAGASQPAADGSAPTAAPTSAAPSARTSGSGPAPTQAASSREFQTPSGDVTCEMDQTRVYCQTASAARSVTMDATGKYTTCSGQQCLANAGEGTPTLDYGDAVNEGPFRCMSAVAGLICVADGKGFGISNGNITPANG
jgi:hypothetical protein